ncbi:MAG: hypothetical protein O3A21_02400 [Proteobacteria bacterium]|nr:hypothetical protein [Pseudomonadota bacterium]
MALAQHDIQGLRLLAHDPLGGHGCMGEGVRVQLAGDGRRILWLAHERAPKGITAVDVSDPRRPSVILQTDLPHVDVRTNSLGISGDLMAVAYQTSQAGAAPAGFELYDISTPESPKLISFFDASGPASRGVHNLWFCDGEFVHMASGAADFTPHHPLDDQFYRIVDVRDPSRPIEIGRWWLPGTRIGDTADPPARHPQPFDCGIRAHNTNVYPERPDRCYIGLIDAGAAILDISDKGTPKLITRWDNSPPFSGFTHTLVPIFSRGIMVATDEAVMVAGEDYPKHVWILDGRDETNLVPISTCPQPPLEDYIDRGGRFGAHNLHENHPDATAFRSETLIFGTFFNAGLRVYDLSDPYSPKEVASFVPADSDLSYLSTTQLNDVFVDDRGVIFTVDRCGAGLYILELDL